MKKEKKETSLDSFFKVVAPKHPATSTVQGLDRTRDPVVQVHTLAPENDDGAPVLSVSGNGKVTTVKKKEHKRVFKDNKPLPIVYFCRACKSHFINPTRNGYGQILCPKCNMCSCNETFNKNTDPIDTCSTCGCKLGMYLHQRFTIEKICLNCNRDALAIFIKNAKTVGGT